MNLIIQKVLLKTHKSTSNDASHLFHPKQASSIYFTTSLMNNGAKLATKGTYMNKSNVYRIMMIHYIGLNHEYGMVAMF